MLLIVSAPVIARADVHLANPFAETHCFKLENVITTQQGANLPLQVYKGKARIVKSIRRTPNTQPEFYVDIPHANANQLYPVIVLETDFKGCEKIIQRVRSGLNGR